MSNQSKLLAIGAVIALTALAFAYVGGWLSPHRLSPARMIAAFEAANGPHPGFRRNHAKGLCVTGYFDSNGAGRQLSEAEVFAPGRIPVVGRFALAGGQPFQADANRTVRSLALRFSLPNGEEWRTGMNAIPVFPVNTPEAFYEQLLASRPEAATGKPDPARMADFLARHPESARAIAMIGSEGNSSGFANSRFNSLDAFRFVAANGATSNVRWAMVPNEAFAADDGADSPERSRNYLFDALIAQLQQQPLQWHLMVTIARPGDPTNDATQPWPVERAQVDVGTLTVEHAQGEDGGACRDINFDPLVLPVGIEPSDDPLLSARSAAYSRSFTLRAGETKPASAVQTPAGPTGQRP
ncbi:MAG TPA: catalase family peroxidase [Steroidobacteraceae bacterium]|nr:catalase family peroxidase [Steroidobacteraceae bacterium]